jgi:hypothetical protein
VAFAPGTRVLLESESVDRPPRTGTVEEVLREDPPRYRIRWDDGHETIYTPAAGALREAERQSS